MSNVEDRLMNEAEAAERLGLSKSWLRKMRWLRQPPGYIKFGTGPAGSVRYRRSTLDTFIAAHERDCASDHKAV